MYIDQLKGWQPELEAQKADVEEQLGAQTPEPGHPLGVIWGRLLIIIVYHCIELSKKSLSYKINEITPVVYGGQPRAQLRA